MIREFFVKLVIRAKEVAKTLKEQFRTLAEKLRPGVPVLDFPAPVLSCGTEHALHIGKCYRLTSDHSPVFSLYTFFPDQR
jgi:hypothetical protein